MSIISSVLSRYKAKQIEEFSLQEYLDICKKDKMAYATPAERLLFSIGEPKFIKTENDPKLSKIFANRILKYYPNFDEFYGLEDPIEQIISYLKHSAQGLEEKKQILYLLGPVGGGKSSIAEKLKSLMQNIPIYAIKGSPIYESPLGLFNIDEDGDILENEYGIPKRYVDVIMSPWAHKRLQEYNGDINRFKVIKIQPSIASQIAISKTEPGDENNQDISCLVGKIDIRKLEHYSQDNPDAYSFSGGLCRANRGLLEFVEMFKAPLKILHPLLTATQEGNYNGTEAISSIPFDGIIMAHSNESEWLSFKNNRHNEAFLDRVYIVKVPYCLRISEEVKIYEKLIQNSSLSNAPCAPCTLKIMAQFSVLSRLKEPENSNIYSKMKIYDGEILKDIDPKARSYQEYKDYAGVNEGMTGLSTRFAFKILSKVFNYDLNEISANPVHLFSVLEKQIEQEQFSKEIHERYISYIKGFLIPKYIEFIGNEIQTAYFKSYSKYGQNIFDRYITYADFWIQNKEYHSPNTDEIFDQNWLNKELEKIEKPAGIANVKDFRHEIINFISRAKKNNKGKNPNWTSYEKLKLVIEKKMLANIEDLLLAITFNTKNSQNINKKYEDFIARMIEKGYTKKQVEILCDWYAKVRKSN